MSSYGAALQKLHKEGLPSTGTALSGGEAAGHLTYAALTQPDPVLPAAVAADDAATMKTQVSLTSRDTSQGQVQQQDTIVLPRLTDQEKQSPIGYSLGYLIGLFFSLKEQLDRQRRQKELAAAEAEKKFLEQQSLQHAAVYDSFAKDQPHEPHHPHQQSAVTMAPPGDSNNNMNPPPLTATATATIQPQSSTRSNLEQSSMMKREMRSQMTFQTKLRALKQQELNKYNKLAHDMAQHQQQQQHFQEHQPQQQQHFHADDKPAAMSDHNDHHNDDSIHSVEFSQQEQHREQEDYHQATGESGTDRPAMRSLSMGDDDEFWNTAVVDDELFDFLMND